MNKYEKLTNKELMKLCSSYGVHSLSTTESAKAKHSADHGTLNTILYLAPWNLSGHQVCPGGTNCHEHCLSSSGLAKISSWSKVDYVTRARIARTKLFYADRELFMELLVREIRRDKREAKRKKMSYAVRLNGTSDLSPILFKYGGKQLFNYFHGTQFYDYTKVYVRTKNEMPKNYDLTLSFDGYNEKQCLEYLSRGGRVAVVFDKKEHPTTFWGHNVVCGDEYDMRFLDPKSSVIGLTYHSTSKDFEVGEDGHRHYKGAPDTAFVVRA